MLDGRTMPSSLLGEREVDKELISLSLHAVSGGYCSGIGNETSCLHGSR